MKPESLKVLLVSSSQHLERGVSHWLESAPGGGFQLTGAAGLQAEAAARDADALLYDCERCGVEECVSVEWVRRAAKQLPVIILGDGGREDGVHCLRWGAQDYLNKREIQGPLLVKAVRFAVERKRREAAAFHQLAAATSRLISPEVVKQMAGGRETTTDQRMVTVLFADIRGFTAISEQYPKEVVVRLLNHLLEEMSHSVLEEKGYVDKFLGDGLMAVFGAPKATENDWLHAARAAYKMQARLDIFNQRRLQLFPETANLQSDIRVGIGIHSGTATVGFIGSAERAEYTAVGDCVNIAARLCAEANGGEILLTAAVTDGLAGHGEVGDWRIMQLKGKAVATEVATLKSLTL